MGVRKCVGRKVGGKQCGGRIARGGAHRERGIYHGTRVIEGDGRENSQKDRGSGM